MELTQVWQSVSNCERKGCLYFQWRRFKQRRFKPCFSHLTLPCFYPYVYPEINDDGLKNG